MKPVTIDRGQRAESLLKANDFFLRDGFLLLPYSSFQYFDEIAVRSLRFSLLAPNHTFVADVFLPDRASGHDEVFCDER